ncbi:hypothetical protein ACWDBW_45500 [Streptomyces sp. NPDC001107]
MPQLPLREARMTATSIPRHLRLTWDHEWLVVDRGNATVGITAFAAAEALKPSYDTDTLKALADKHPLYPGL